MSHVDRDERATLLGLQHAWTYTNNQLFLGRLKPVVMELVDLERVIAAWDARTRTIRFSRGACAKMLWPQVYEVLKHEMAHQYVSEVLGVTDEGPHGRAFRETCARLGIDARAAGVPDVELSADEQAVIRKVRKLRALAGSSNPNESSSAQAMADRLVAEFHELFAQVAPPAEDNVGVRHVGPFKLRRDSFDRAVAHFLGEHGGVRVIMTRGIDENGLPAGTVMELLGPPSNLERAAYLHDFVVRAIQDLWHAHRAELGGARRTRTSFMVAALREFGRQLEKEPLHAHALVPAARAHVDAFVRARYPRLRTTWSRTRVDAEAAARGASAGRSLHFRPGVAETGGPRLLGPGGRGDD